MYSHIEMGAGINVSISFFDELLSRDSHLDLDLDSGSVNCQRMSAIHPTNASTQSVWLWIANQQEERQIQISDFRSERPEEIHTVHTHTHLHALTLQPRILTHLASVACA